MLDTAQRPRSGGAPGFGRPSPSGPSSFGDFCPVDSWAPPTNIYRRPHHLDVCMDVSGMDKQKIDVHVEPGRLTIRGEREAPQPPTDEPAGRSSAVRIVMMEIDHGPFCRQITLPEQADLARVESRYDRGMLWVHIPLRRASQER